MKDSQRQSFIKDINDGPIISGMKLSLAELKVLIPCTIYNLYRNICYNNYQ